MTALLPPAEPRSPSATSAAAGHGLLPWFRRHRASLLVLVVVLALVGAATGWNLQGWPGRVNDDEGTYVAEAWALLYPHHLSPYTYWYDHPPLGWMQLAAYIGITDGFSRLSSAVMAGREFMWWVTLVSSLLLYVLGRRLGFRRGTAAFSVLAFGLSPLAIYYHRMVSLDNIAVMWFIAALACAASRRRNLAAAFGSAICMAAAVLSKETVVILLPVALWVLYQHTDQRTRRWHFGIFGVTLAGIVSVYPLFALLRGELLPGQGHVSLGWALWWQFFGRAGSGSLLDASSGSYVLVHFWATLDPWLLLAGVGLIPAGFAVKRLRPLAFALLLQIVVMLKGGYLPYFYVTAMLPFPALLMGGVADQLLDLGPLPRAAFARLPRRFAPLAHRFGRFAPQYPGAGVVAVAAALMLIFVVPGWWDTATRQSTVRGDATELAATAWVEQHVPKRDVVVTDDYLWPDLKLRGWNPLWLSKIDTDPQVMAEVLPHGYKSIQYIVLYAQAVSSPVTLDAMPTMKAALAHSVLVRSFGGGLTVRRVIDR
jgi:4-amino-4-deoxy-L-arabinose transferase-like glycosyltransferase